MRPVSIALGGVFALILTGAAAAAPLNPQPPPPGRHAPTPQQPLPVRQVAGQTFFVACASRKSPPMVHKAGGAQGQTTAASRNAAAGGASGQTACPPGRR